MVEGFLLRKYYAEWQFSKLSFIIVMPYLNAPSIVVANISGTTISPCSSTLLQAHFDMINIPAGDRIAILQNFQAVAEYGLASLRNLL